MKLNMKKHENESKSLFKMMIGFAVMSFIIMAICSESSFLYPFNTEVDVSCFYTVARCLKRGDILYKDIYEHKGLYLYWIYMMADVISPNNYLGIYVIQSIFATIYMYAIYKTIYVLSSDRSKSTIVAIMTSIATYTSSSYWEGGFAEEFAIPLVAIVIYMAVRYYSNIYTIDIPKKYTFSIGVITAIMFWIKYTIAGIIVGLALFVLIDEIKNKRTRRIIVYFLMLSAGFITASIPAVFYFVKNDAVKDLLNVYFYNLIFVYDGASVVDYSGIDRLLMKVDEVWMANALFIDSSLIAIFMVYIIVKIKDTRSDIVWNCIACMFFVSSIIVGLGVMFNKAYQALVLCPFIAFSLYILIEMIEKTNKRNVDMLVGRLKYYLIGKQNNMIWLLCVIVIVLHAIGFTDTPFRVIFTIGYALVIKYCSDIVAKLSSKLQNERDKILIKYVTPILCILIAILIERNIDSSFSAIKCGAFLAVMLIFIEEWDNIGETICVKVSLIRERIVDIYTSRNGLFCTIMSVTLVTLLLSNNVGYMLWKFEDTPQYGMKQCIENSGIEDPVIYHLYTLDSGIFNVMGLYPKMKYYGYYNIELPETQETIRQYVDEKGADFIITANLFEEQQLPGYSMVYYGKPYMNANEPCFCLYQKVKEQK